MSRQGRDFVADQKHTEQRIRALEVGTHPTIVQSDAYGRNTPWKKIGPAVPFEADQMVDFPGPADPEAGLYRCVRADILIFKTISGGLGVPLREADDAPEYLFTTGKTGKSADSHRFTGLMEGVPVQLLAAPNGAVYCVGRVAPAFSGPLVLSGGWSLG